MPKQRASSTKSHGSNSHSATRRGLLAGAGALVAGVGLARAAGAQTIVPKTSANKAPRQAVVEVTKGCRSVGNACLRHCQRLTRLGDKSLADCMRSVSAMLPVCLAMNRLRRPGCQTPQGPGEGLRRRVADCEAECRKHQFHRVECKRCAEACAATVKVLTSL